LLKFFRINDPYRMIFIFLILVIIRVVWMIVGLPLSLPELKWMIIGERLGDGFTMYKDLYDHTGPLSAIVYKSLDFVFGRTRWSHIVFSTLLITIQAGIFNNILLKNKAYDENSYLPAFFYVVFMSGVLDFFALSPQLMSLTFILLSLNYIFRRIDNVVTDELFIYSGLYLGLASAFYLPAGIFFLIFLLSFILFSSAVPRRLVLLAYSSSVIFAIIWMYFFWFDAGMDFLNDFFVAGWSKSKIFYLSYLELLELGAFLIGLGVLVSSVIISQRMTNYQQKMLQVMIVFFLAALILVFLSKDLMPSDMIFLIPPMTFFSVYYFLGLRRRIWRALLPYIAVIGVLIYPAFWLNNYNGDTLLVNTNDYTPGENLMGIGVPLSVYAQYRLSGPFLDPYVSEKKLNDVDYYDEASEIYEALQKSTPDLIIDEWGVAEKLFYRFPDFGLRYRQLDANTYVLQPTSTDNSAE